MGLEIWYHRIWEDADREKETPQMKDRRCTIPKHPSTEIERRKHLGWRPEKWQNNKKRIIIIQGIFTPWFGTGPAEAAGTCYSEINSVRTRWPCGFLFQERRDRMKVHRQGSLGHIVSQECWQLYMLLVILPVCFQFQTFLQIRAVPLLCWEFLPITNWWQRPDDISFWEEGWWQVRLYWFWHLFIDCHALWVLWSIAI